MCNFKLCSIYSIVIFATKQVGLGVTFQTYIFGEIDSNLSQDPAILT